MIYDDEKFMVGLYWLKSCCCCVVIVLSVFLVVVFVICIVIFLGMRSGKDDGNGDFVVCVVIDYLDICRELLVGLDGILVGMLKVLIKFLDE